MKKIELNSTALLAVIILCIIGLAELIAKRKIGKEVSGIDRT